MRRIKKDTELLVVARTLLSEISKGLEEGKCLVFTPDNIQIPKGKEIKRKNSFKFKAEIQDIPTSECFRLLGVILYHLAKGQSEYTHEAYHADPVDAYLNLSFESELWPVVASLVKGEVETVERVEQALASVTNKAGDAAKNSTKKEAKKKKAKKTKSDGADDIIQVDRSVQIDYPRWANVPVHLVYPDLENTGPSEYNINQIDVLLHPDQEDGDVAEGNDIYDLIVDDNDDLEKHLGMADLIAIHAKGLRFYRKHFKGKQIFAWKSVVQDEEEDYHVPYLVENGDKLSILWYHLNWPWDGDDLALFFKENTDEKTDDEKEEPNNVIDNTIRVDRSIQPDYPLSPGEFVYPQLQNTGPSEYNISQVEEWLYPDQEADGMDDGNAVYDLLVENSDLERHLGLADLVAIHAKGVEFYRKHYKDKALFAWKSIVQDENGAFHTPYLVEDVNGFHILWHPLDWIWGSDDPALCFKEATTEHIIDCDGELTFDEIKDWRILSEDQLPGRVCGQLEWDPSKVELYLSADQRGIENIIAEQVRIELASHVDTVLDLLEKHPELAQVLSTDQQDGGLIDGMKLYKKLANKPVLKTNVLNYLLDHPELIPEECMDKYIYFWGTIFRDPEDNLYVCCMLYNDSTGSYGFDYVNINNTWNDNEPAILYND